VLNKEEAMDFSFFSKEAFGQDFENPDSPNKN